jgi:sorting nexin-9/18/33
MATLPQAIKPTSDSSIISNDDTCPRSKAPFDAGIHSSSVWTEHLECYSQSDDEPEPVDEPQDQQPIEETVKAARALYDFEGEAEFRELTVEAGDELNILKEEAGDGWSLVRASSGEIGLLPQTYYTVSPDHADRSTLVRSSGSFRL